MMLTPVRCRVLASLLAFGLSLGVILFLVLNGLADLLVYAQLFPPVQQIGSGKPISNASIQTIPIATQQKPILHNPHLIKIVTPTKGQQVPIGPGLKVTGTTVRNATTADCGVTVKVNGISPYQDVLPVGNASSKDYSKWNYTLNPSYASIQLGQNKITAKLSCSNNPNIISHSSVNVTGITKIGLNSTSTNYTTTGATTKPVSSNATARSTTTTGATTKPVLNTKASDNKLVSSNQPAALVADLPKVLSVSIHLTKNTLRPGDEQTIMIRVSDKNSKTPVSGALISGKITDPTGPYKKVKGTTDDSGKASYSWTVGSGDQTGTYKFATQVSAGNYEPYSTSKTFKVNPIELAGPSNSPIQETSTTVANRNTNPDSHQGHFVTPVEDKTYTHNDNLGPTTSSSLDSFNSNSNNVGHHNHHNHSTSVNPSTDNSNSNNNYLGPTIGALYGYNRVVPAINPSYTHNDNLGSTTSSSLDSFNTNSNNVGHHNHHNHSTSVNPSTGNTIINKNVNNNINNNIVNNNINAVHTNSHRNHQNPSTDNSNTNTNNNKENLIPATNPSSTDNTVANPNTNANPDDISNSNNVGHHNHHNHSTSVNPSTDNSDIINVNVNDSKSEPQSSRLPQINPIGSNSFVTIPSVSSSASNAPIITSGPTNTPLTTSSDQSNPPVMIPSGSNSGSISSGNSASNAPIITSGPTNTPLTTSSDQSKAKDNVPFLLPFH